MTESIDTLGTASDGVGKRPEDISPVPDFTGIAVSLWDINTGRKFLHARKGKELKPSEASKIDVPENFWAGWKKI